jgi:hypothetical protein
MAISEGLFLAILSMDAYNRGYGYGLKVSSQALGDATVSDIEATADEQNVGFAAVSYTVSDPNMRGVSTVISYRGTDNPNLLSSPVSGGSDIMNGWAAGGGFITAQTNDAIAFYQQVTSETATGANIYSGGPQPGVIVTGHSLGGGLAGLVSALSGTAGVGFDYMPFGLIAAAYDAINGGALPDFSNFTGVNVDGEILQYVRSGQFGGAILAAAANSNDPLLLGLEAFVPIRLTHAPTTCRGRRASLRPPDRPRSARRRRSAPCRDRRVMRGKRSFLWCGG